MPANLVTLQQFEAFLGGAVAAEAGLRQGLLDDIEALFLSETGRTKAPFAEAELARVEKKRGTGTDTLYLDYPIADVTVIKLGFDSSDPDDTLDPDDKDVVIWTVGDHSLTRVDGGYWGRFGSPAYCHITYDTQDDLPSEAGIAIQHIAAMVYRQRGAEDASSETIGGQTYSAAAISDSDLWKKAVGNCTRVVSA